MMGKTRVVFQLALFPGTPQICQGSQSPEFTATLSLLVLMEWHLLLCAMPPQSISSLPAQREDVAKHWNSLTLGKGGVWCPVIKSHIGSLMLGPHFVPKLSEFPTEIQGNSNLINLQYLLTWLYLSNQGEFKLIICFPVEKSHAL